MEVELVTTLEVLGVVDEVDEVDADVEVTVGDVNEALTEVVDSEMGIDSVIDVDAGIVPREVLSVTESD